MRVEQFFVNSNDRNSYRIRIEGKNGQAIEIVEQMDGGFLISGAGLNSRMNITPIARNTVIVEVKP